MYKFYLDGNILPITPSKLQMKIKNQNRTLNLINDGEINLLKQPGLTEIEFNCLIPQSTYPFRNSNSINGSEWLNNFESLKVSKKPFQFIILRKGPRGKLLFDTNIKVSLEDYSITEDSQSYGLDMNVQVRLKQYRDYGTKTVVVNQNNDSKTLVTTKAREVSKETPKSHTVVSGDTLWAICKRYLGEGSRYPEIANLNNIKNPNLIYPGQVIRLE